MNGAGRLNRQRSSCTARDTCSSVPRNTNQNRHAQYHRHPRIDPEFFPSRTLFFPPPSDWRQTPAERYSD